ncbi:MAG: response regulator transcription factor [Sphingobacteriales bacterium]|nr:MAG: response regulator transcription factor [Sphingobacteriales bacterium]
MMKPVVLMADDNIEILDYLGQVLEPDYTVIAARNGAEALQIIEKDSVHTIISDIMMPVMDGFELCKRVKSNFNLSHIPFILLTAKKTLEARIDGLEFGADAYVEKPFSPKYLLAQVSNLIANRTKLKDFYANSPVAHLKSIAYSRADEEFLGRLHDFINENIRNQELDVEQLARAMNMSRPTFYRKIKEVSDLSPNELMNLTRLKKAAELLVEGDRKIYEIADTTGFASQHHFARSFLKQFGMTPSEYQATNRPARRAREF